MGSRRCSLGVGAGTKTGNELANTSIGNNENEKAAAQDPKLTVAPSTKAAQN